MNIDIKHYGYGKVSSLIDLIVSDGSTTMQSTITDIHNKVSQELIESLENIVEELKEHNELVKNENISRTT